MGQQVAGDHHQGGIGLSFAHGIQSGLQQRPVGVLSIGTVGSGGRPVENPLPFTDRRPGQAGGQRGVGKGVEVDVGGDQELLAWARFGRTRLGQVGQRSCRPREQNQDSQKRERMMFVQAQFRLPPIRSSLRKTPIDNFWTGEPGNEEQIAAQLAKPIIQNDHSIQNYTRMRVAITRGYDPGVAGAGLHEHSAIRQMNGVRGCSEASDRSAASTSKVSVCPRFF
jgi:hypothetical protein